MTKKNIVRMMVTNYARRLLTLNLILVLSLGLVMAVLALIRGVDSTFFLPFASALVIAIIIGLVYIGLSSLILWVWSMRDDFSDDVISTRHRLQTRSVLSTLLGVPTIIALCAAYVADRTPYADIIDGWAIITMLSATLSTLLAWRAATQTALWLEAEGHVALPKSGKKKQK